MNTFHLFHWILFICFFKLINGDNLRGSYINLFNKEKEYTIQNYINIYGMPIYKHILMNVEQNKYSFYEFGCIPFTEDMKNTEIVIRKKNYKTNPIFVDNGIDYSFKVYSCYSHYVALNLLKKERNMLENKNDYIPNNEKYNHFKYYYFEELETYSISFTEIQERINLFILEKLKQLENFDNISLTNSYEKCCRIYTIHW